MTYRVGDKVKCIKSHPDLSGFGMPTKADFIEGEIYPIVDVHPEYASIPYSVVLLCDPVTNIEIAFILMMISKNILYLCLN